MTEREADDLMDALDRYIQMRFGIMIRDTPSDWGSEGERWRNTRADLVKALCAPPSPEVSR